MPSYRSTFMADGASAAYRAFWNSSVATPVCSMPISAWASRTAVTVGTW